MDQLFLSLSNINKRYGNTIALNKVTFACNPGEIHAILGENGAGKSTLIKIITGIVKPDQGNISIFDKEIVHSNPSDIINMGLSTVYQELSLIPDLSVAKNLFLGIPTGKLLSDRTVNHNAAELLCSLGIEDIAPYQLISELSLSQQQKLEIARALGRKPKILLLDEATSALNPPEVDWLFRHLYQLKQQDCSIVFISHRIDEIRGLCNRLTILRNGENVGTYAASEVDNDTIIRLMLGRSLDKRKPKISSSTHNSLENQNEQTRLLEVNELKALPELKKASFHAHVGEIIGIAGLAGQGQLQLFSALFGISPNTSGQILIREKPVKINSPQRAISNGIIYIPADRGHEGLLLKMPVFQNMSLPVLKKYSRFSWIDQAKERQDIVEMAKRLDIATSKLDDPVGSLSGGNQQKVLIGKWLLTNACIIMLYDPTRGVDIGTKFEINSFILQLASEGRTILYYSTDINELIDVADRILVFYQGEILSTLNKDQFNSETVLAAATGHLQSTNADVHND